MSRVQGTHAYSSTDFLPMYVANIQAERGTEVWCFTTHAQEQVDPEGCFISKSEQQIRLGEEKKNTEHCCLRRRGEGGLGQILTNKDLHMHTYLRQYD